MEFWVEQEDLEGLLKDIAHLQWLRADSTADTDLSLQEPVSHGKLSWIGLVRQKLGKAQMYNASPPPEPQGPYCLHLTDDQAKVLEDMQWALGERYAAGLPVSTIPEAEWEKLKKLEALVCESLASEPAWKNRSQW